MAPILEAGILEGDVDEPAVLHGLGAVQHNVLNGLRNLSGIHRY
jgi:hypothetical protein